MEKVLTVAKQTLHTTAFGERRILDIEQRLEQVVARYRDIRLAMSVERIPELWAFNTASLKQALRSLERAAQQLQASLDAAKRGHAYGEQTTKADLGDE